MLIRYVVLEKVYNGRKEGERKMKRLVMLGLVLVFVGGCGTLMGTRESYVRIQADQINAELNGPYLNGHVDAERFLFISAPGKATDGDGSEEVYEISEEFYPGKEDK